MQNNSNFYKFNNSADKDLINEILSILNIDYISHTYFTDGTSSKVILLNDSLLIKQNLPTILKSEIEFLSHVTSSYFQRIVYFDPNYKYAIYKYIPGNTIKTISNVDDLIEKIILITTNYSNYSKEDFGYLSKKTTSWKEFLFDEINDNSQNLNNISINCNLLYKNAELLQEYPFEKKLLHGDFGTHNFIENKDKKLVGVIDPYPIIGDYLYDLLFAITSNKEILSHITPTKLHNLIKNEPNRKIDLLLSIILYSRLSRCLKYHPNDFSFYIDYWNKYII